MYNGGYQLIDAGKIVDNLGNEVKMPELYNIIKNCGCLVVEEYTALVGDPIAFTAKKALPVFWTFTSSGNIYLSNLAYGGESTTDIYIQPDGTLTDSDPDEGEGDDEGEGE